MGFSQALDEDRTVERFFQVYGQVCVNGLVYRWREHILKQEWGVYMSLLSSSVLGFSKPPKDICETYHEDNKQVIVTNRNIKNKNTNR